jgi:hypothetical protein
MRVILELIGSLFFDTSGVSVSTNPHVKTRTQTWWDPYTTVRYHNSGNEMESAALIRRYDLVYLRR